MDDSAVLKEEGVSVAPPQAEGAVPAVDESPCIFQALKGGSQLLPEIRIDTSRLDGLLTSFQRRLQILETSFARIAESAAEAAHKVLNLSSPSNTSPPSRSRSATSPLRPKPPTKALTAIGLVDVEPQTCAPQETPSTSHEPKSSDSASGLGELQIWSSPEAVKPDAGAPVADRNPAHAEVPSPGKDETTSAADISDTVENACTIGPSRREMAVTARVKRKTYSPASSEDSWVQQQLESLWDAMKWVEDRVEVADAQRREELQKASRTAAQNTARVQVASVEQERMKLALQDIPLRSELESLSELHDARLRATEAELRRHTAESSNHLQTESLRAKVDKINEDTSQWKSRLEEISLKLDSRQGHQHTRLSNYWLERELEDDAWSEPRENGGDPGEVLRLSPHPTVNLAVRPFVGDARPKCGNDRSCVECLNARLKRASRFKKLDEALSQVRDKELELTEGVAELRVGLGDLLLRVEEGELLRDQLVQEVEDRVVECGQEADVSLSRAKRELLDEIGLTQASLENLKRQAEDFVPAATLDEAIRGSKAIRDVSGKVRALHEHYLRSERRTAAASSREIEESERRTAAASSRELEESERRTAAKSQAIVSAWEEAHHQLQQKVLRIEENKADEHSLRETRDKIEHGLRTLKDAIACHQKARLEILRHEVATVTERASEVAGFAEAAMADLYVEIGVFRDTLDVMCSDFKKSLEENRSIIDGQDAKVATFSGQVRDACSSMMSSVRSDVLDTLVCLVSTRSGKKADIKLGSRPDSTEVGMAEVAEVVREQQQRLEDSSWRMEKANIGLTMLVRKLERSVHLLSTRGFFWEAIGSKLNAHAEAFGDASWKVETTSDQQNRFVLTLELQQYVAGNTQRVAKLIAQQADFEVLQRLVAATTLDHEDHDWDKRVQIMRGNFLERFLEDTRRMVNKKYPVHGCFCARNRDRFFVKLEHGLKVAMSKYRSVEVGSTLFGKIRLEPACIACNRPFGPSSQATLGDPRAALLDPLPPARSITDAMVGYPRQAPSPMDGAAVDPVVAGGGSGFRAGGRYSSASKFVYRGGFKLPRELTPGPSVDSFGGCVIATNNSGNPRGQGRGSGRSDAPAYGNDFPQDRGDRCETNHHCKGSSGGEDTGVASELGGIISSSRMCVVSRKTTSERGRSVAGVKDDNPRRRPRPQTARATIYRRIPCPSLTSARREGSRVEQRGERREEGARLHSRDDARSAATGVDDGELPSNVSLIQGLEEDGGDNHVQSITALDCSEKEGEVGEK
ncbi:unnamed protein product [Ascophyllum nodosum]